MEIEGFDIFVDQLDKFLVDALDRIEQIGSEIVSELQVIDQSIQELLKEISEMNTRDMGRE